MQIEIPDSLFKRLQKHGETFVDTPATVIEKLLDIFEKETVSPVEGVRRPSIEGFLEFDGLRPPNLLHTRVRGEFASIVFSNWNDLLRIAHVQAFIGKAKSFENLRVATSAQVKQGRYEDEGFHYIPEIGISLQGVDANRAWQHAIRLARYLNVPVRAEVEWRNNEKAERPGDRAILTWGPAEQVSSSRV